MFGDYKFSSLVSLLFECLNGRFYDAAFDCKFW